MNNTTQVILNPTVLESNEKRLTIWPGSTLEHNHGVARHRSTFGSLHPARLALAEGGDPAERARRVGQEPPVDALDVEPVSAAGQEPALLPVRHLPQAHRALHSRLAAAVHEHRQRRDVALPQRRRRLASAGGRDALPENLPLPCRH